MMKTQIVTIHDANGIYTADIEAVIVGNLALHEGNEILEVKVTHIKTSCLIACFSDFDDAVDFAENVSQYIDFDAYAQAIADLGAKAAKAAFKKQVNAARKFRASYGSCVSIDSEPSVDAEFICARLANVPQN